MEKERIDLKKQYKIMSSCIGCRNCYRACPAGAISTGPMKIHPEKCIGCGKCYKGCPGRRIVEY